MRNQRHAEFSHCRQNWYYGLQAMYSSMALKRGGSMHIWTPTLPESEGSGPHRIAATVNQMRAWETPVEFKQSIWRQHTIYLLLSGDDKLQRQVTCCPQRTRLVYSRIEQCDMWGPFWWLDCDAVGAYWLALAVDSAAHLAAAHCLYIVTVYRHADAQTVLGSQF